MTLDARQKFLEKVYTLWGTILVIWALYRKFLQYPEAIDELIFKPIFFVLPVFVFVLYYEKRTLATLGLHAKNFVRNVYLGLGVGTLFVIEAIALNTVKYGVFTFSPQVAAAPLVLLGFLAFAISSAFCEELLVRGFFFTRLSEGYQNTFKAAFGSIIMYAFILVPAVLTRLSLDMNTVVVFGLTSIILSVVNTIIFQNSKSLVTPILVHAFWNMVVLLYL